MSGPFDAPYGDPNYSGYDNAVLFQTFQSGMVIQTPCFINTTQTPPLVSDLKPVDASAFQGKEIEADRYIEYCGTQYTSYNVQSPTDKVVE